MVLWIVSSCYTHMHAGTSRLIGGNGNFCVRRKQDRDLRVYDDQQGNILDLAYKESRATNRKGLVVAGCRQPCTYQGALSSNHSGKKGSSATGILDGRNSGYDLTIVFLISWYNIL